MKTIYLKSRFDGMPLHALYQELIKHPPDDYQFLLPENPRKNLFTRAGSKHHNYFYKQTLYHLGSFPYFLLQHSKSHVKYDNYDLIYASQHVVSADKSWVVDLEYANALAGYCNLNFGKGIISKRLESNRCKAIFPWSQWAKETLVNSIDSQRFKEKIHVIRYTVSPKQNLRMKNNKSGLRILFLGSMNPANVFSFEFKGLYETIDAFIALQGKYDGLELVIRSIVPEEIKQKYRKFKNIKILESPITKEELEELFVSSDIFPHSGFEVLNLSVLEAMSYGLPVIATSLYNTPEAIVHMKNGLLIDLPNPKLFYTKNNTPNDYTRSFLDSMRKLRPFMMEKLKEYMKMLIEDSSLRNRLGNEAASTIAQGEFSIENRNRILKRVFDMATS